MKLAVIGATGAVGRQIVRDLEESDICVTELLLLASPRSRGLTIPFRGEDFRVQPFSLEQFRGIDFVLMSAGAEFSRDYAYKIAEMGNVVIDNSSAWRMDPSVPLVVPEINGNLLKGIRTGVVANPNCCMIQLAISLQGIVSQHSLQRVHVSTYQAVSGAGQKGVRELEESTSNYLAGNAQSSEVFREPVAFNVLSGIGPIRKGGTSEEEEKIAEECSKVLGLKGTSFLVNAVRVPVLHCHSQSVQVKLDRTIELSSLDSLFEDVSGLVYISGEFFEQTPSPMLVKGSPMVFAGRARLGHGETRSQWLQYWNVADNLKKGAATNAVQILSTLLKWRA